MNIMFLNAYGGGFHNKVWVDEGTTVQQFLEEHITNFRSSAFDIRLNSAPCSADQELRDGDQLAAIFRNQKGGR